MKPIEDIGELRFRIISWYYSLKNNPCLSDMRKPSENELLTIYAFSLKICVTDIIYNIATFASTVIVKELGNLVVWGLTLEKKT